MQHVKYNMGLFLISCLFFYGCSEKAATEQTKESQIIIEDLQGYWKSYLSEVPVNIDSHFQITETGLPTPTGLRNDLQYYFYIKGNEIDCYVKCIFDAYFSGATENPVYTILLNKSYTISVENQHMVRTDIFEDTVYGYVALKNDASSMAFLREDLSNSGYSHISFTLNTTSESEWDSMISEAITPKDSGYKEIYEKVFNNF